MKKTIFILILTFPLITFSQEIQIVTGENSSEILDIYTIVEKMPRFQGENEKKSTRNLHNYLKNRLKKETYKSKGTVYINFVVDSTGKIINVKILRGVNSQLDKLALLYIQEMPIWIPGQHREKKVKVSWNLPIHFK